MRTKPVSTRAQGPCSQHHCPSFQTAATGVTNNTPPVCSNGVQLQHLRAVLHRLRGVQRDHTPTVKTEVQERLQAAIAQSCQVAKVVQLWETRKEERGEETDLRFQSQQ